MGGYHRADEVPALDYQYDANGNMIYDPARELNIYYNYLNLPERFEFEDCRTIDITYDAGGVKLQSVTRNGGQGAEKKYMSVVSSTSTVP